MNKDIQHKVTSDGSSTLFSKRFQEHYHSLHGALNESQHVFIEMGLSPCLEVHKELRILEVGLGTGLNALLTALVPTKTPISYHAIEKFPLTTEHIESLNYPEQIGIGKSQALFEKIHQSSWGERIEITDSFSLEKHQVALEDYAPSHPFHLVYFDAFAPNTQPELWTTDIFAKIYSWCEPQAILVTYSSKGSVRRSLLSVGFQVEKLPGPPGKREMLRAIKD